MSPCKCSGTFCGNMLGEEEGVAGVKSCGLSPGCAGLFCRAFLPVLTASLCSVQGSPRSAGVTGAKRGGNSIADPDAVRERPKGSVGATWIWAMPSACSGFWCGSAVLSCNRLFRGQTLRGTFDACPISLALLPIGTNHTPASGVEDPAAPGTKVELRVQTILSVRMMCLP